MKKLLIGSSVFLACSGIWAQEHNRNIAVEEFNRTLVVSFYNDFFNKHDTTASKLVSEDYKQHNPNVPNGKKPFVSYFKNFFKENPKSQAKIIRSATDGDLVYLHVHATNGEKDKGQAILDIFRIKNGKIIEHWDITQNVPAKSENNNTMF